MKTRDKDVRTRRDYNKRNDGQDIAEVLLLVAMKGLAAKVIFVLRLHRRTQLKYEKEISAIAARTPSNNKMGFRRKRPFRVRGRSGSSIQRRRVAPKLSWWSCAKNVSSLWRDSSTSTLRFMATSQMRLSSRHRKPVGQGRVIANPAESRLRPGKKILAQDRAPLSRCAQ